MMGGVNARDENVYHPKKSEPTKMNPMINSEVNLGRFGTLDFDLLDKNN